MTKKADVKISLHFIIGLIFSVVLILLVLGAIDSLSDIINPHYERDLVDQWAEDIELINTRDSYYATELLPMDEIKTEGYFIAIFQQETKSINFDLYKNRNEIQTSVFPKPRSCKQDSCICTYNIKNDKFEYCKRIGADQIHAVTPENKNMNTSNGIVIFNDVGWERDNKQYSDTLVAASKVYAQVQGSWVYICFKLNDDNSCK